jgi:3-oxoacyl-[acyl-carrier-protein] synthase II
VISEGAGVVLLENLDHALGRGAKPYCEVAGSATEMDSDPICPGSGLENTMSAALANAGCSPAEIDYICAYGPGHPVFDKVELAMIRRVFGARAAVPISSIKGVTGNPLAAAGPLQLIASALAMRNSFIPPTANCENLDTDYCTMDIVRGRARHAQLNRVLVNVRGLGGGNGTLIVRRVAE